MNSHNVKESVACMHVWIQPDWWMCTMITMKHTRCPCQAQEHLSSALSTVEALSGELITLRGTRLETQSEEQLVALEVPLW